MFTFRKYKKIEGGKKKRAKHPKLIVDENGNQYGFMGLTESSKRGNHKNIEIRNPEKNKGGKSYIRNELRYDDKKYFSLPLKNYKLHKEDYDIIIEKLNKHKKKANKKAN